MFQRMPIVGSGGGGGDKNIKTLYSKGEGAENWDNFPFSWSSQYSAKNVTTFTPYIDMNCNESNKSTQIYYKEKVDITDYSRIVVVYEQTAKNSGCPTLTLKNNKTSYVSDSSDRVYFNQDTTNGSKGWVFDISAVANGSYYLVFEVDNSRAVRIQNVYLVK